ncbi:unnamed protein product [Rhizoctonia solani]|uniref:CHAT domain-containing protein n=3 Tax=Rhizoctonia solani TaxID=456999 RepID=A0A8H3BNS0_9AGAM|nr:CHAT domain protein [Rhizoctonia solani AG-3 Rhs1AP]KEP49811.1 CHAT domain protein [Rhizoctonia solani 123E]CAE6460475.1 unnamed protein product [Rhizoctonia solani]CAE6518659.1 unnamed protein product [Rhizoctonia solani]
MIDEPSNERGEPSPQPRVIYNLNIDYESLQDELPEEESMDEEYEPSPQEIQMELINLMGVPYEFQDFDESHLILARVLSVTADGDPSVALIYEIFDNLCDNYPQRIEDANNHLYSAPIVIQDKENPQVTYDLGLSHKAQFNREGMLDDLERSIGCMKKAVEIAEEADPELPKYLVGLADSLFERFERFSGIEFLEAAIDYQRRAISLMLHPKPQDLDNLGYSLLRRFQAVGHVADLEEAIQVQEQSVSSMTTDTEVSYTNLAASLVVRFENSSHIPDLDRAIDLYEKALKLDLETDTRATVANNIGAALQLKYLQVIDDNILGRAIEYQIEAVESTSDRHTEKPRRLTNLGNSLHIRFEHHGNTADIQSAISHQLHALRLLPKKHILRVNILNDLGKSYLLCFGCSGKPADIEQCLSYLLKAMELTPVGNSSRPKCLFNLGHALRQKFESQGQLNDIDEAIAVYYEAVSLTPETHMDRAEHLDHLGSAYMSRYERLDEIGDLDRAIQQYRAAILIYGSGNKRAQASLNNFGIALLHRFKRLDRNGDINEAIDAIREAIALSAKKSNTPILLNSLSVALCTRYEDTKQLEDITESVSSLELAITLTPEDHPGMPFWLNSLHNSLRLRCNHTGNLDNLVEAIEHQKRAVYLTPECHSDRPAMLRSLGDALGWRYTLNEQDGMKQGDVIDAYRKAALSDVGKPLERFEAACSWAQTMTRQHESPLEAYRVAFRVVPQVVWMGAKIDQRYLGIARISRLTNRAVASAITEGQYSLALEWFEESRSIVWRQMLDLRTPLDELRDVDQLLAQELERVAHALDQAGSSKPTRSISMDVVKSLEQAAQSHHRLAEEWDKLLAEVRQIDIFSDFLKPKKASTLMKAAHDGPVIAINVHETRCDALVLSNQRTPLDCVPLPRLSYHKALDAQRRLIRSLSLSGIRDRAEGRGVTIKGSLPKDELKQVFEFLWDDVVQPILEHLQYLDPKTDDELPHITWCLTGPLAFLPLHAAGRYTDPSPKSRIFNYVISSYTPTINGLLSPTVCHNSFSGILAVGQASTPGLSALPGTKKELESIARHAKSLRLTQLTDQSATPKTVLDGISNHSWVHFACHASQVPQQPTSSAFYLHTGTLDLNTITKQSLGHKAFAFLSACQTATGDLDLPEEAVHLAAGMIMAGYPTVIATMWSINDNDAPLVAEHIYAEMLADGKPDSTKAYRALHRALSILRDKVGEGAFVSWVPYIHIGI